MNWLTRRIVKLLKPRELLKIGNRSYVNAFKYPESRFDVKDLLDGGQVDDPSICQVLRDPGKLFTDQVLIPPSQLIFQLAGKTYRKSGLPETAGQMADGRDARTLVQDAINTLAPNGGVIFFKKAEYAIYDVTLPHGTVRDYAFIGEPGTVFKPPAGLPTGWHVIIAFGGFSTDKVYNIRFENIVFDTTNLDPSNHCETILSTAGEIYDVKILNCDFYFPQLASPVNYFYPTPVYLNTAVYDVWIKNCRFFNMGKNSVVPVKFYIGRNAWVEDCLFQDCNNPVFPGSGGTSVDFWNFFYRNITEQYRDGIDFPCEGLDLENVGNVVVEGVTQRYLGSIPATPHQGGLVIASNHPVQNVEISDCSLVARITVTPENVSKLMFSNNTMRLSGVKIVDGAGNPLSFDTCRTKEIVIPFEIYEFPLVRGAGAEITGSAGGYTGIIGSETRLDFDELPWIWKAELIAKWDPKTTLGGLALYNLTDSAYIVFIEPGAIGLRTDVADITSTLRGYTGSKDMVVNTKGDGTTAPTVRSVMLRLITSREMYAEA